jgi:ATP-binding cassette, subfamily B, bacterial CvaB/MchF/RaxB
MNKLGHASPSLAFWTRRYLPMIFQSSAAECGLACLAMVASYWGLDCGLHTLRRRFPTSLKGLTLKRIAAIADGLEFTARPIKVGLDRLKDVSCPAILHWGMNHFVVLKSISRGGELNIHDPATGVRCASKEEVDSMFTGVALELRPRGEFSSSERAVKVHVMGLIGRVHGLSGGLAQLLLLGLLLQVLAVLGPFYMQWVVDEALPTDDRDMVLVLAVGFTLLVVLKFCISAVRGWITVVLSTSLNFQWLGNVFRHLLRLPVSYFENRHLGDIVSRFGSIHDIQRAITTQLIDGVIDGVMVSITFAAMMFYSWRLTGLAAAVVAVYCAIRLVVYKRLRQATAEAAVKAAKQQTLFLESIRGLQTIRLLNKAHERHVVWMNAVAEQMNVEVRVARLSLVHSSLNTLLFGLERVAVVGFAAALVLEKSFSIGMMLAFLSYKDQFSERTAALIDRLFDLRLLRVQVERLADIVLAEPEPMEEAEREPLHHQSPPVLEIRRLSFRYSESDPYILKDISLTIASGQCIAFSGVSGCGKTTLVKLLLGLLVPTDGEILVDGRDIRHVGLGVYRAITGSVMQDDILFAGTIFDNVSFFDPDATAERVERCARLAALSQEIEAMPMRYMSLVGDMGTGLSGGQKQRLVLARALYSTPRILVLDEATSHLDLVNEQTINNAIQGLQMTRIVVAHRPDTIAMADRHIVLDGGEIVFDSEIRGVL